MSQRFQFLLPTMGRAAASLPWYLSGGIDPANVAGVYQAEGAASQAAAVVNLANPGTNDLSAVGAPTWDAVNGFAFNGTDQAYDTGLVPASDQTWSAIVKYANNVPVSADAVFGAIQAVNGFFALYPKSSSSGVGYANGRVSYGSTGVATGIMAIAGNRGFYVYGNRDVAAACAVYGTALTRSVYLAAVQSASPVDWYAGNILAVAFYKTTALTAFQVACLRLAMEDYSYVSPALTETTLLPANLFENGYSDDKGNYYESSCFAFARFISTTRILGVVVDSNGTPGNVDSQIGVWVDGAPYGTINVASSGLETLYIVLPAGSKTVDVLAGMQSKSAGTLTGTFLVSILTEDAISLTTPTSSGRMVIYGDSIAVGDGSIHPTLEAWSALLREDRGNVMVEGWGFRTLKQDCVDAAARTAFAARLAGYSPTEIWIAIGTNDYGEDAWSAADFGAAYADMLDKINTALPAATIYCQTPIDRTDESANTFGDTLGDYRTEISDAVATRGAFCTLVDGTDAAFPQTPGDLTGDGVHPTTAGHAKYAAAVESILGI